MSAVLFATHESNLLTFQTNAAWLQRVHIVGTEGIDVQVDGSGHGSIHWQRLVGPGRWTVEAWYRVPGGDWWPSQLVTGARGLGQTYVAANDDSGDRDYDDTLVSCVPVTRAALETAADFLKRSDARLVSSIG